MDIAGIAALRANLPDGYGYVSVTILAKFWDNLWMQKEP